MWHATFDVLRKRMSILPLHVTLSFCDMKTSPKRINMMNVPMGIGHVQCGTIETGSWEFDKHFFFLAYTIFAYTVNIWVSPSWLDGFKKVHLSVPFLYATKWAVTSERDCVSSYYNNGLLSWILCFYWMFYNSLIKI